MSIVKRTIGGFILILAIPVLSVLYAGLILSACISVVAGILRTLGFHQLQMSIGPEYNLPVYLSIPFALLVASLLFFASVYVKRSIRSCMSSLKID